MMCRCVHSRGCSSWTSKGSVHPTTCFAGPSFPRLTVLYLGVSWQLHSSDLASIYALPAQLAKAAVQVDYLVSPSAQSLDEALLRLATTCGSVIQTTQEGDYTPSREMGATGVQIVKTTVEAESDEEGRTDRELPSCTCLGARPYQS